MYRGGFSLEETAHELFQKEISSEEKDDMETLRTLTKWISRHRTLSLVSGVILIALVIVTQVVVGRLQGVLSEPIRKGTIIDAVYGIGTVAATRSYSIKPGVMLNINTIFVKEGDFVHRGDRLLLIDDTVYHAPFNGTVNFLPFKVGENIPSQLPALVLTDLSDRYIIVTLEQQGALRVKPGQKAKISFDSMRAQSFDGVVESVYSYNGNFLARIDLSSLPKEVLPDMTADVAIVVRDVKDALLIPVAAFENGYVWAEHGRTLPKKVEVQLGIVDGTTAEVISGDLNPGDRLMIHKRVSL